MNGYLIPANSKKSQLIFGLFKLRDLIILLTGVLVTLVFLFLISDDSLIFIVIKLKYNYKNKMVINYDFRK